MIFVMILFLFPFISPSCACVYIYLSHRGSGVPPLVRAFSPPSDIEVLLTHLFFPSQTFSTPGYLHHRNQNEIPPPPITPSVEGLSRDVGFTRSQNVSPNFGPLWLSRIYRLNFISKCFFPLRGRSWLLENAGKKNLGKRGFFFFFAAKICPPNLAAAI